MADMMTFPDTVEEFMEEYKLVDTEQVYTNGTELVPIFRMKQWFEHEKAQLSPQGTTFDTISRQAAIDGINHICPVDTEYDCTLLDRVDVRCVLSDLPTIQPERKKGEWLPDNNNAYEMRFVCSCCKESEVVPTIGFTKYKPLWDFCPNCGADMRGEKDG
jgi:hypothetical protein